MAARKELWILTIPNGESKSYVLNITEPFDSMGDAERRVRWMQHGSGQFDTWLITTFSPEANAFVTSGGNQYRPFQAGYTDEAWNTFKERTGYSEA